MANRPPPPMYNRVRRRMPPKPKIVVPTATLAPVTDPIQDAAPSEESKPKTSAKKTTKKKSSKKPKKPIWTEDMTQRELYHIAKKHGLDVRSKDWKSEIIAALKKAKL